MEDITRKQFLALVAALRPKLHRFCTRMCGSALDGEDVVQEALAQAFYHLPSLRDLGRLEPWLFRIAHHKCIDLLRKERRARAGTVPYDDDDEQLLPAEAGGDEEPIGETLAPLVGELPPRERAAVLLKDVLDYTLAEVADVVEASVGSVKAALHRGRAKLRALRAEPAPAELDGEQHALLAAYVDCFNRQDWAALRQLIRTDAQVEVVDRFRGDLASSGYTGNYAVLPWAWRLAIARIDGELAVLHLRQVGDAWAPHAAVRLAWRGGRVARIRDYVHVDYLLRDARIEVLDQRM